MFVGIDPPNTLVLGRLMRAASNDRDELRAEVEVALRLSELASAAPGC